MPSHLSRHVQLADLVARSTTGMVGGSEFAPPVFQHVSPPLIQAHTGARGGTGLKLFPDELTNLYFHVLGENLYWSGSRGGWKSRSNCRSHRKVVSYLESVQKLKAFTSRKARPPR